MAMIGAMVLFCLYTIIAFPGFFAPYDFSKGNARFVYVAPQAVHLFDEEFRNFYDLELLWGDAPKIDWNRDETDR